MIDSVIEGGVGEKELPDPDSGWRMEELELASVEQAEVIGHLEEAINDMNIGTSNTESRLNILESIATKQKQVSAGHISKVRTHFQYI